ncbi:MAG: imelysin family protein [Pseudomonadota bacterium]
MRAVLLICGMMLASPAFGAEPNVGAIVDTHVIPGYQALSSQSATLAQTAEQECAPTSPDLVEAYHKAFDAWVSVSHLRFGPSEEDDRAFALAFWPDPRGSTPKALATLIRDEDSVVADPQSFSTVSIAARGFYALEFLLFDPQFAGADPQSYTCTLIQAVTADIARNAADILAGWQNGYGDLMSNPGNDTYRTSTEAAQQVFTALSTGLEFTSQTRLGRPMGSFERPRPNRAEARRSERSLRHVVLSLEATQELAALLSMENPEVQQAFDDALQRANALEDPVFAGVANPIGRLRVEALQQSVERIRAILAQNVGPSLGISAGFNALDGD